MVHLPMPELPPSALAGDQATSRHGRWTGSVCVPELPPPSEDGASKLKATRTQFQAAAKGKATAPSCALQLPHPDSVGDAQARKACTTVQRQLHRSETRGGVMRRGRWMLHCRHPSGWYIHWARHGGGGVSPSSQDVGLGDNISVEVHLRGGPRMYNQIESNLDPIRLAEMIIKNCVSSLPNGLGRFACRNTQITHFGRGVWAPSWSKASHSLQHAGLTQHYDHELIIPQALHNHPQRTFDALIGSHPADLMGLSALWKPH